MSVIPPASPLAARFRQAAWSFAATLVSCAAIYGLFNSLESLFGVTSFPVPALTVVQVSLTVGLKIGAFVGIATLIWPNGIAAFLWALVPILWEFTPDMIGLLGFRQISYDVITLELIEEIFLAGSTALTIKWVRGHFDYNK